MVDKKLEKALEEKDIKVVNENGKKAYYINGVKVQCIEDNGKGSRVYCHPDGTKYHFPGNHDSATNKCWLAETKDDWVFYGSDGKIRNVEDRYLEERYIDAIAGWVYDDSGHNRVYTHPNGKKYYFSIDAYPYPGSGRCFLVKDKNGNNTIYSPQSGIASYTEDKKGNRIHYKQEGFREDARIVSFVVDKEGNRTYYKGDGKTVSYIKYKEGNETHFKEDGKTVSYTKDKNGKKTYYKEDGKTVSYSEDNMLARARFKLASKIRVEWMDLPEWVKVAEGKASRKIEAAKNKLSGKTKKTTVQKPTRTNGGRS